MTLLLKDKSKEAIARAHATGMRYIGGRIAQPSLDESNVKQRVIAAASAVQNRTDSRLALQVQERLDKLARCEGLTRRTELLYLLLRISEAKSSRPSFAEPLFKDVLEKSSVLSADLNTTRGSIELASRIDTGKAREKGNPAAGISEAALLHDVLYALLNIEGHFIGLEENGHFHVKPEYAVSEGTRRLVGQCCTVAFLFRSVVEFLKPEKASQTEHSFADAVQHELVEYYRWVAVLENLHKGEELTLRRLLLWEHEPEERLRWVLTVCEAVRGYKGAHIISILNSFRPQGDLQTNALCARLLTVTIKPFLKWAEQWVLSGRLEDPHEEFFIREKPGCRDWQFWEDQYVLL